jgi:hypothetical protein
MSTSVRSANFVKHIMNVLFVLQNFFGEFIITSDIGRNLTGSNMRVDGVPA